MEVQKSNKEKIVVEFSESAYKLFRSSMGQSNLMTQNYANGKPGYVDMIDPESITYEDFFRRYLVPNRPCLFTENLTKDWNSRKHWVKRDKRSNNELDIDFDYLSNAYGEQIVSVTNCDKMLDIDGYGDGLSCQRKNVQEFLAYWQEYRDNGYPSSMPCLYLKDWHIMKGWAEGVAEPYTIPIYFASDWLNESCEGEGDDFKFTYMGPKGSWTGFHADVYGSYSWSANVVGVKKWLLYPPGKENIFRNPNGSLEYSIESPGVKGSDYYEVFQRTGQTIFVPSGWHHIVWNLEDTISINHNWMNAGNVNFIWRNLQAALDAVKKELNDLINVEDFNELCQNLLKANHGMNYSCFRKMLSKICLNRQNRSGCGHYSFGSNHSQFDIEAVEEILHLMSESSGSHGHEIKF